MKSFGYKTHSYVLYITASASRKVYKYIDVYVYIYKFEFTCVLLDFIGVFNFDTNKGIYFIGKIIINQK